MLILAVIVAKGRLGKNEEAMSDFDQAIDIDPKPRAYHNKGLAMALLEAQKTEKNVRESYEKQLEEQRPKLNEDA